MMLDCVTGHDAVRNIEHIFSSVVCFKEYLRHFSCQLHVLVVFFVTDGITIKNETSYYFATVLLSVMCLVSNFPYSMKLVNTLDWLFLTCLKQNVAHF